MLDPAARARLEGELGRELARWFDRETADARASGDQARLTELVEFAADLFNAHPPLPAIEELIRGP